MIKLTVTGPFTAKDQVKADLANKFIGFGRPESSTAQYAIDAGKNANTGEYCEDDIVFISANGGKMTDDWYAMMKQTREEILKAVKHGVTFITDKAYHRHREYNTGERNIATFLRCCEYDDKGTSTGVWVKQKKLERIDN
jgi:hypothetical protein